MSSRKNKNKNRRGKLTENAKTKTKKTTRTEGVREAKRRGQEDGHDGEDCGREERGARLEYQKRRKRKKERCRDGIEREVICLD